MTKTSEKPRIVLIHSEVSRTACNTDSIEGMTRDKDKPVSGTFINIEAQGQSAKVCGKYYKGMPYFCKVFEDGEVAQIPLSVARFINERCIYDKHDYLTDDKGQPMKLSKPIHRYKFIVESKAA